jgi:hypothetical protein
MKKEIKRLPEQHLAEARKMVVKHKKKKKCNKCFDRGYLGVNEENMLIPCTYCIDSKAVFDEWKTYVKANPDLVELYGDSLDEKEGEGEGEEKDFKPKKKNWEK